jgi:hypothetical protein
MDLQATPTSPRLRIDGRCAILFADETREAQAEARKWQKILSLIIGAPRNRRGGIIRDIAATQPALSEKTIRNRLTKANKAKSPEALLDALIDRRTHKRPQGKALPQETVVWLQSRYLKWQRQHGAARRVYEELIARWQRWRGGDASAAIPGYRRCPRPEAGNANLPRGFSYANVCRLAPPDWVRRASAIGPRSASALKGKVYHSRVDAAGNVMPFGSVYWWDDNWHDLLLNYAGYSNAPIRPVSFYVMEALSTYRELGIKPRMRDLDDGKMKNVNETDFFWFWIHIMQTWGYNPIHGTTNVMEKGTATIRDGRCLVPYKGEAHTFAERLHELTSGKVCTTASNAYGNPAIEALLIKCDGGGNFRFKAPIEGSFNLDHNLRSALPGQLGRNPDNMPEELTGWQAMNKEIMALIDDLPAEVFVKFRLPFMHFDTYKRVAYAINGKINGRTEHKIQGWEAAGFTGFRWRLSQDTNDWGTEQQWLAMSNEQRQALEPIVMTPGHHHMERLSPADVFDRHIGKNRTLTDREVYLLAPEKFWKPLNLPRAGSDIIIHDKEITADALRFRRSVINEHGERIHLDPKKSYMRLLNPINPNRLVIARADGSYLGSTVNIEACFPDDDDTRVEQYRQIASDHADNTEQLRLLTHREQQRRKELVDHNKRLKADPRTDEEKARDTEADDALRARRNKTNLTDYTALEEPEEVENKPSLDQFY